MPLFVNVSFMVNRSGGSALKKSTKQPHEHDASTQTAKSNRINVTAKKKTSMKDIYSYIYTETTKSDLPFRILNFSVMAADGQVPDVPNASRCLSVCSSSVDVGRVRWPFEPNLICFRNKERRKVRVELGSSALRVNLWRSSYLMGTKRVLMEISLKFAEKPHIYISMTTTAALYIIIISYTNAKFFVQIISSFCKMTQSTCAIAICTGY